MNFTCIVHNNNSYNTSSLLGISAHICDIISKISLKLVTCNNAILSFLHDLKLTSHKLHFAENPFKIRHLVPEI